MKLGVTLGAAAIAAALACSGASAQTLVDLYADEIPADLTAPTYFEGFYAGILFGASGADHRNFYSNGNIDRIGAGGVVGYNHYLMPGVIVGGEVQANLETDLGGAWSPTVLGLGHLGFTTADDFQVYLLGGGGLFDNVPAWAIGAGVEWGVYDNMSVRGEIITVGQAGASPTGVTIPGITAWLIKGGAIWRFGEGAFDMPGWHLGLEPPADVTDFNGPYAGLSYGIHVNPSYSFFPDVGFGLHLTRGDIGGFAGWNWRVNDFLVAGVEAQGGYLYDTSGDQGANALALGRAGIVPLDGLLVYGAGGVGFVQNKAAYALGGGVEYALWGDASVRAEVLGIGELSAAPAVAGFSNTKFTMGAVWHLD